MVRILVQFSRDDLLSRVAQVSGLTFLALVVVAAISLVVALRVGGRRGAAWSQVGEVAFGLMWPAMALMVAFGMVAP